MEYHQELIILHLYLMDMLNLRIKTNFEIIDMNKQFIHQIPLLVINTNIVGNAKNVVGNVRILLNKHGMIFNPILNQSNKSESLLLIIWWMKIFLKRFWLRI